MSTFNYRPFPGISGAGVVLDEDDEVQLVPPNRKRSKVRYLTDVALSKPKSPNAKDRAKRRRRRTKLLGKVIGTKSVSFKKRDGTDVVFKAKIREQLPKRRYHKRRKTTKGGGGLSNTARDIGTDVAKDLIKTGLQGVGSIGKSGIDSVRNFFTKKTNLVNRPQKQPIDTYTPSRRKRLRRQVYD